MIEQNQIYHGDHFGKDAPNVLASWPDDFIDAVVTDPPYELGFMGKSWDSSGIAYSVKFWEQVLRVMKPGAHLLAFGGTRTYHRMAVAIETAGFDIRDQIQWLYGSGFPKSLDVSKAINKASGVEFEASPASGVGFMTPDGNGGYNTTKNKLKRKGQSTDAAKAWDGWGTALKPANEPVCLARKPLSEDTVAANVLKWGTGALNIEAARIPSDEVTGWGGGAAGGATWNEDNSGLCKPGDARPVDGRWPANILFDRYAAGVLDGKSPEASRFFYVAKPDGGERESGLERESGVGALRDGGRGKVSTNFHPTVKPVDLMAYLIQLVTPDGGIVLDPFMGSGTTGMAAVRLNRPYLGVEKSEEYIEIARARIAAESQQGRLL